MKSCYHPIPNLTIDEQIISFRGRCPFRQYIKSKPQPYGIKVFCMCDSENHYCCNTDVYTGKMPNQSREVNQSKRVVLQLVEHLDSGYNITCDNFFSSHDLAKELYAKNLTMVGTVRKNKTFLPPRILNTKERQVESSVFVFTKNPNLTITSYVPKKGRNVILMSTLHHDKAINTNIKNKPEIIMFYNKTKAGVDILDKKIRSYSCKRQSRRWPLVMFMNMLDVSAHNAYVLFKEVNDGWKGVKKEKRRLFLRELAQNLIKPQIARRKNLTQSASANRLIESTKENLNVVPTVKEPKQRFRCGETKKMLFMSN